jgi:hypothetical protein
MAYECGSYGFQVGSAQGSELLFVNNTFLNHNDAGLDCRNFNALQWTVIGGRFVNCDHAIFGGGSMPGVIGCSFENSTTSDIVTSSGGNDGWVFIGCRTNSNIFMNWVGAVAVTVSGCIQTIGSNGYFAKSANVPMTIKACQSNLGAIHSVTGSECIKVICSRFDRSDWHEAVTANWFGSTERENVYDGSTAVAKRTRTYVDTTSGVVIVTKDYSVA